MPGIEEEPVGRWLDALASAAPAPGGGAAAALAAATGAGLVEMVCNLTIGKPAYAESEPTMRSACRDAATARTEAVALADEDATAFTTVMDAYKLPKQTEEEQRARSAAIEGAMIHAAAVPLHTGIVASRILDLVSEVLPGANLNVISDLAVAAASAGAALDGAAINIAVNRGSIRDSGERTRLAEALTRIESDRKRANALVAAVQERIAA